MISRIGLAVVLAAGFPIGARAAGDAAAGAKVFNRCRACHVADKEQNRVGPHLVGIVGRPVASVDNFRYSDGMAAKGAEGAVWEEGDLAVYLANPKAYVPGTSMAFPGLKKPDEIDNIIAYLKSASEP